MWRAKIYAFDIEHPDQLVLVVTLAARNVARAVTYSLYGGNYGVLVVVFD
jgi:hypothetical protein